MPAFIDLTGMRFGKLVVLTYMPIENNQYVFWLCKCDCGKNKVIRSNHLRSLATKSCGCAYSKLAPGMGAKNGLLQKYKAEARKRGFVFELTNDVFYDLVTRNCYYCDQIPTQEYIIDTCYGSFIYNGIDRLDNKIGYTIENSVTCCKACNYAKHTGTSEDYIQRSIRIARKWSK